MRRGDRLQAVRVGQGFTTLQLAEQAGVEVEVVRDIERGRRYPQAVSVALAQALGVTVEDLTPKKRGE